MPLTTQTAAVRARQIITEESEGRVNIALPRLQALVPTALETWARMCLESREKRELLKRRFTANVSDGVLDLTPFVNGSSGRINLKELRETVIYSGTELDESESEEEGSWLLQISVKTDITLSTASPTMGFSSGFPTGITPEVGWRVVVSYLDVEVQDGIVTEVGGSSLEVDPNPTDDVADNAFVSLYAPLDFGDGETPYTWLNSKNQLKYSRPIGTDAPACFLEGNRLYIRAANGALNANDQITFTVTNYLADVTEIPLTLEHDFLRFLAFTAMGSTGSGDKK